MTDIDLRTALRARPIDGTVNLAGQDPAQTPFVSSKSAAKDQLDDEFAELLFDQHELLFASGDRSVLLVLQGLDCSGKNGTIKHVINRVNPAGVRVASFGEPTEAERAEHFLERYRRELPPQGKLVVFDRSHYEDLLVPLAERDLADDELETRIAEVGAFEQSLIDAGTIVVKCMLHISYDEQRDRFLRRLRRDDKRWKFSRADLETRRRWNEFQAAYSVVLGATSTDHAPWYIVPSDHKWYRNWAIARLLIDVLHDMGNAYPQPDFDLDDLRAQLEPPG